MMLGIRKIGFVFAPVIHNEDLSIFTMVGSETTEYIHIHIIINYIMFYWRVYCQVYLTSDGIRVI